MAGSETLLDLLKMTGDLAPVGQGFADRQAGYANAAMFRTQAAAVMDNAAADESAARMAGRSEIAQQVANASADGATDSSQMDVIRQNEVNLIADALAIRRRGQVEAAGYESRARVAKYEGDQALYGGISGAGSKLLMTAADRAAEQKRLETLSQRVGYGTGKGVN